VKLKKRYRVKITRWGYIYILITIIISLGAANTSNNLLYLLAAALLAIMLISGLSSMVNITGLKINIHPPQEAFAATPAPFRINASRGKWPLPSALVGIRLHEHERRGLILSPGEKREVLLWVTLPRRGMVHLTALEVFSSFPFGFFTRSRILEINVSLVVFPHPIPAPVVSGEGQGWGETATGASKGWGNEVLELRLYQKGDPMKMVEWKATARRGELISKEMSSMRGEELIVELKKGRGNWEETLSKATYLVTEALKRGMAVGLVLPNKVIKPQGGDEHRRLLLEALALA
jgi:uncharacterized protein (DUF58 family)